MLDYGIVSFLKDFESDQLKKGSCTLIIWSVVITILMTDNLAEKYTADYFKE